MTDEKRPLLTPYAGPVSVGSKAEFMWVIP